MIQFQSFEKKYGKTLVIAVSKLKLTSKIYWIHGKNGSGKSTLLQSIAGMLRFNGDIKIEDYSLKKNPSLCKSWINYAPAEPRYPPFLTGKEIIQLYIQTKNGDIKNVDYLITELGMSNYMDLPIVKCFSDSLTYPNGQNCIVALMLHSGRKNLIASKSICKNTYASPYVKGNIRKSRETLDFYLKIN